MSKRGKRELWLAEAEPPSNVQISNVTPRWVYIYGFFHLRGWGPDETFYACPTSTLLQKARVRNMRGSTEWRELASVDREHTGQSCLPVIVADTLLIVGRFLNHHRSS